MENKSPLPENQPLPLLRGDIKIFPGPENEDGSPSFNCYDPIRAQYFQISWIEMVILQQLRPNMTLEQLVDGINKDSTVKITLEDATSFFEEASKHNLLKVPKLSESMMKEVESKKTNPLMWMMFHYLYIRVPLLNPDAFLTRTLHYVRPLVSTPALWAYVILTFIGLFHLVGRFDDFLHTFPYFFNLQGAFIYGLAISVVKIIHEFSHAYVAKHYKLHIPTMGIAFIVLWPVLYTDVTDGWKLKKRSQRLAISFAGVAAEVVLAGLATLGWGLTEAGLLQSVFFIISSVTWISTLVVNLNPAMRFDGYYMMCDIAGIDNLQARAFAYTRWKLRKLFLGINVASPEETMTAKRSVFMMSYSIYTWLYRIILYTGIAVFVYLEFTKVLGIVLFIVEIIFFITAPFYSEAKQLKKLAPHMTWNWRSIIITSSALMIISWYILPFPHWERFPALTIPIENQNIYVPHEGKVEKIYYTLGQTVHKGDLLAVISSTPLDIQTKEVQSELKRVNAEIHVASLSEEQKGLLPGKNAELLTFQSKLKGLIHQKEQLRIRSTIDGNIYERDELVRPGEYVLSDQILAKIAPLNSIEVVAFVPEAHLTDIHQGQIITFRVNAENSDIKGRIKDISPSRTFNLQYPQLASLYKGDLPTVENARKEPILVESYFMIKIELIDPPRHLKLGQTGYVWVQGPWKSKLVELLKYLQSVYWQESGF